MRELLIGIAGAGKTRRCLERCRAALAEGAEPLYLVPNRAEAELVRGRLLDLAAGDAAVLPGILTPRVLARRLLDRGLPGWSERDALGRRLQLAALLDAAGAALGPLARSAATAGFPPALDRLLAELEQAGLAPADLERLAAEQAAPGDRDRLAALAELARRFEAGRDPRRLDGGSLLPRAAALLDERGPDLLPGSPPLLMDGFAHLSPVELRFLRALLPQCSDAALTLALDPAELEAEPRPPFEAGQALARELLADGGWTPVPLSGESHRFGEGFLLQAARGLFRTAPGAGDGEPGASLRILQAATPRDEAEGLLREIRRELAAGTPPERMAVIFRAPRHGDLLAELLDANAIPFHWESRRSLALAASVDLCLLLLDWAAGHAEPEDLPQRLRGFVATDDALLAELAAAARGQGLPGAAEAGWDDFLAAARARHPDASWTWLDWRAALGDAPLAAEDFRAAWLAPLVGLLLPTLSASLEAALGGASGAELGVQVEEARALDRLLSLASTLAAELDGLRPPGEWAQLLRRAAEEDEPARTLGREGGGVLLGNPFELRLPELDTVFVCGLNEGVFPPAFREDPLLRDAERRDLSQGLPDWTQRRARERYLFYVACTRASRRLWLSWSQRDEGGRLLARSQFVDEFAHLCAELPEPVQVPALSLEAKLSDPVDARSLLRDRLLAGSRREAVAAARAAETWLRGRGEGPRLDGARRAREERPLTGHPALGDLLGERPVLSASRLEDYAECPFRFLGRHLLGLEQEGDFEAGALEEGRVLHRVLELFYGEGHALDADTLAALHERAIAELAADPRGPLPSLNSPRFRAGDARRLRLLLGFLERDRDRMAASGFAPRRELMEWPFELDSAELPGAEAPGDGPFRVVGRVDRVDVDATGRELVLDYKRGDGSRTEPVDAEPVTRFQLALYALARAGRAADVAGAAYMAVRAKTLFRGYFDAALKGDLGAFTVRSETGGQWLDGEAWSCWQERTGEGVRDILRAVRRGELAPLPRHGVASCRRCELRALCRWSDDDEEGADA